MINNTLHTLAQNNNHHINISKKPKKIKPILIKVNVINK